MHRSVRCVYSGKGWTKRNRPVLLTVMSSRHVGEKILGKLPASCQRFWLIGPWPVRIGNGLSAPPHTNQSHIFINKKHLFRGEKKKVFGRREHICGLCPRPGDTLWNWRQIDRLRVYIQLSGLVSESNLNKVRRWVLFTIDCWQCICDYIWRQRLFRHNILRM